MGAPEWLDDHGRRLEPVAHGRRKASSPSTGNGKPPPMAAAPRPAAWCGALARSRCARRDVHVRVSTGATCGPPILNPSPTACSALRSDQPIDTTCTAITLTGCKSWRLRLEAGGRGLRRRRRCRRGRGRRSHALRAEPNVVGCARRASRAHPGAAVRDRRTAWRARDVRCPGSYPAKKPRTAATDTRGCARAPAATLRRPGGSTIADMPGTCTGGTMTLPLPIACGGARRTPSMKRRLALQAVSVAAHRLSLTTPTTICCTQ